MWTRIIWRERKMFYLTTHSTHFIYSYMASDIWLRTILIVRKETRCRHIGYSYRLTATFFYMHHPTDRITHTTAFVTPVVEHWLEREIVSFGVGRNCLEFRWLGDVLLSGSIAQGYWCCWWVIVVYIYFRAYIDLRFKHTVMDTHLSRLFSRYC